MQLFYFLVRVSRVKEPAMKTLQFTLVVLLALLLGFSPEVVAQEDLCFLFVSDGDIFVYQDEDATPLEFRYEVLAVEASAQLDSLYIFLENPDFPERLTLLAFYDGEPLVLFDAEEEYAGSDINERGDLLFSTINPRGDYDTDLVRRGMGVVSWISAEGIFPAFGANSQIAATNAGGELTVFELSENLIGGEIDMLQVIGEGQSATWSEDGESILFVRYGEIVSLTLETGEEQVIEVPSRFRTVEVEYLSMTELLITGGYLGDPIGLYLMRLGSEPELFWEEDGDMSSVVRVDCQIRNPDYEGEDAPEELQ